MTLLPIESQRFQRTTVWAVEKSLDTIAFYQLGGEGDVIYRLVSKVTEHDRSGDNDGYVTIEEVSNVACETFMDRGAKVLWASLVLQLLIPLVILLLSLPLLPPMLAWMVRRLGEWRASRRCATTSTPDSKDQNSADLVRPSLPGVPCARLEAPSERSVSSDGG